MKDGHPEMGRETFGRPQPGDPDAYDFTATYARSLTTSAFLLERHFQFLNFSFQLVDLLLIYLLLPLCGIKSRLKFTDSSDAVESRALDEEPFSASLEIVVKIVQKRSIALEDRVAFV